MENTKKNFQILDCTLRDGGSLINCRFDEKTVINIMQGLNDADIDIAEAGFLKAKTLDCNYYQHIFSQIKNKKINTAVMIDYDNTEYSVNCAKENFIDLIRLMFKKNHMKDALLYAEKLKDNGCKISLNPASVTAYDKDEIKYLFKIANKILPEIVYIIDTYGLLDSKKTIEYLNLFEKYLDPKIKIGFHAHNNKQLAFSNSLEIINNSKREIIIDGSLYGMGKRAGNMPVELFIQHSNYRFNTHYKIDKITELITDEILPLKEKYKWGYNIIHYIAAVNSCHSDYVSFLIDEKKLSVNKIYEILNRIPNEKKLTFNKELIEKLYRS